MWMGGGFCGIEVGKEEVEGGLGVVVVVGGVVVVVFGVGGVG